MRIVFKPLGILFLVILPLCIVIGVVLIQRQQLQAKEADLAQAHAAILPASNVAHDSRPIAIPDGVYRIRAKQSGLYLGCRNASTDPSADGHIDQQPMRNDGQQKWRFIRLADGSYNIQNTLHSFWLDDTNASLSAGDFVRQWFEVNRTTNDAQKWLLIKQKDGSFQIRGVASGKVLEIHGASKNPGALVYQEDWQEKDSQKFVMERLED